jgi:hypothetical protein
VGHPPLRAIVVPCLQCGGCCLSSLCCSTRWSSSRYVATLAMPPLEALSLRATVNQSRRFGPIQDGGGAFRLDRAAFSAARRTTTGGFRRRRPHDWQGHSIRQRRCSAKVLRKVLAHGLRHAGRSLSRSQERDRRPCPTPPVILHHMWIDATEFRWRKEVNAAASREMLSSPLADERPPW